MQRSPFKPKEAQKLDPSEVPEVAEFIVADQELSEYVEEVALRHPGVLEQLQELAEKRNVALEAADKAVRAWGKPCGPFEVHQIRTEYDAVALYDAVGKEKFEEWGGSVQSKLVYELDSSRFEAAVSFKKVSADVLAAVKKVKVAFKSIRKAWTG